jgi:putative addiction module killer protein
VRIVEYLSPDGRSPFSGWFADLDPQAAAKVAATLARIELGNLASLKSVGDGVLESRIDWGPGYRLYLGREGSELVILLAGGTKRRQQEDIKTAQARWRDYKSRRKD